MAIDFTPINPSLFTVIGNPFLTAAEIRWDLGPVAKRTGIKQFNIYTSTDGTTFVLQSSVKNFKAVVPLADVPSFIKISSVDGSDVESAKSVALPLVAKSNFSEPVATQMYFSNDVNGLTATNVQSALDEIVAKLKAASVAGF
jgi:hypothetical protein